MERCTESAGGVWDPLFLPQLGARPTYETTEACTGMPDSIEIPTAFGGGTIRLPHFTGVTGFVSAEDAAECNAELDRVYACYEPFLRDWPAAVNRVARVLPFNLVLENAGTGACR